MNQTMELILMHNILQWGQRPTTEDQQRWRGRTASNLDIDTQAPSSYATSRNESEYWATSMMTSSNGLAVDSV